MAQVSTKLKHYILVDRKPAEGGFAEVWEAVDQTNNRLVAIKILSQTKALRSEEIRRFRLEAEILKLLDHPNVVKVFELDQDKGCHFIVMEYIDGPTVKQLMREGALPREQCLKIVHDCLGALEYVHRFKTETVQAVVHRDLKPSNIMIDRQTGRTVLVDFGIAAVRGDIRKTLKSSVPVGTPEYMSPEQFNSTVDGQPEPVDFRSDLYSLGVILFEMLTGRLPFAGHDAAQLAYAHVYSSVPTVPFRKPDPPRLPVDTHLQALILKAMRKKPAKRFQSAAEMSKGLEPPSLRSIWGRRLAVAASLLLAAGALGAAASSSRLRSWAGMQGPDGPNLDVVVPPTRETKGATLIVWAESQGELVLDGVRLGRETPAVLPDFPPGAHTLDVIDRLDGMVSPGPQSITATAGETLCVRIIGTKLSATRATPDPRARTR